MRKKLSQYSGVRDEKLDRIINAGAVVLETGEESAIISKS